MQQAAVVAISNGKGGVGKTTTTVNLADALAGKGYRVLVVDLDASFNCTFNFGIPVTIETPTIGDVIQEKARIMDAVIPLRRQGLAIVPSDAGLMGTERWLKEQRGPERRLALALEHAKPKYDYILIDCPPAFSILLTNALVAADAFLVPCYAEGFSAEGLAQLMETVEEVKKYLEHEPRLLGILLTNFDRRLRIHRQFEEHLREEMGEQVFQAVVKTNSQLKEAQALGKTIFEHDPKASGAVSYDQVAQEFIERMEGVHA